MSAGFAHFAEGLAAGRGQVLFRERVADLDTPVGAFLRLVQGRPNAFLLESVEGGAARGRFSAIGMEPDLVWRCREGKAELNRHALAAPHGFEQEDAAPMESLRRLVTECRMPIPAGLPSIAAGLFGFLGYDMVRQIERLPEKNADVLGIPDAVMFRPTLVAVFDHVRDTLTLVTSVWPEPELDAKPPRSSSMRCSASSLGSASSSRSSRASSSGVAPRGRVPASGRSFTSPCFTLTRISGEAPTSANPPRSRKNR